MSSRQSLADLILSWCVGEVLPGRTMHTSQKEREALAQVGRDSARAAGVALLQAAAAEAKARDSINLGVIAAVIEDDDAMTSLEERLAINAQPLGSPQERAAFVGQQFKDWIEDQAGDEIPERMRGWLQRGWPDPRTRGGVMTFYQAFCGALQRTLRQDQTAWDELLQSTGINAATWRQWLIREADTGANAQPRRTAKKAMRVLVTLVILFGGAGAAGWYWWNRINDRLHMPEVELEAETASTKPSPTPSSKKAATPAPPSATPEPKIAQEPPPPAEEKPAVPPEPSSTALQPASDAMPRVNIRPEPLSEAARLMTVAEQTLISGNPETADRSARSAQDILSARTPPNDPKLAESMIRVGQYWERRQDWAEAARVYQRAVKAYEKTPAENTNPQLQAVNRWASALRHAGRNTEAERLYRMLLQAYDGMGTELRPEMASVAHNLGNVLFATGRLRDAREAYALALKLMIDHQSDPDAQSALTRFKESYAECLRKLGISESQIDLDLRQTLGVRPSPKIPASQ